MNNTKALFNRDAVMPIIRQQKELAESIVKTCNTTKDQLELLSGSGLRSVVPIVKGAATVHEISVELAKAVDTALEAFTHYDKAVEELHNISVGGFE